MSNYFYTERLRTLFLLDEEKLEGEGDGLKLNRLINKTVLIPMALLGDSIIQKKSFINQLESLQNSTKLI